MILLGVLNDSTTFIGTLTTIVVLCVVSQGNFIHGILNDLKVAVEKSIDALKGKLMRPMLLESDDYKEFEKRLNSMDDSDEKLRAMILSTEIQTWIRKFDSNILTKAFSTIQEYIDRAHDSNEQYLSPHYCFLFCLVLFLCDELVNYVNSDVVSSCVNIFLVMFITYSYVLLSTIWVMYMRRFGLLRKASSIISPTIKEGIIHFGSRKALAIGAWVLIIIVYFHYGRFHIVAVSSGLQWLYIIFICVLDIVLLALPVGCIYAIHEITGNLEARNLSYNFTFVHFMFGGILSFAICVIIPILGISMSPNFLYISSSGFIKWGSIVLVLLFGLVFPSYLPYAVFCKAEKNAGELIESMNANANSESHKFLERIRIFYINH